MERSKKYDENEGKKDKIAMEMKGKRMKRDSNMLKMHGKHKEEKKCDENEEKDDEEQKFDNKWKGNEEQQDKYKTVKCRT